MVDKEQYDEVIEKIAFANNGYHYQKNVDVSDMCANINYVLVLPLSHKEAMDQKNYSTQPFVVTYDDQNIKVFQIVKKYRQMNENAKKEYTYLTYKNGLKLNQQLAIRSIQKQLGRTSLNGLVLYTGTSPQFKFTSYEELLNEEDDVSINESAVSSFLDTQQQFGKEKNLALVVQIPLNDRKMPEIVNLKIEGTVLGKQLKQQILNKIKLQFGVNFSEQDLGELVIKENNLQVDLDQKIISQKIFNKSRLMQNLKNKNTILKRPLSKDYRSELVIYKIGEKDPQKFDYNTIAEMTFEQIYNNHLQLSESKKRKDIYYGLKIEDTIIKPQEKINIADKYFRNQSQHTISVVGKVVDQKMVFFYTIPTLLQKSQQFKIDKYIKIPSNQQQRRNKYRELLKQKTQKTENQYFKVQDRVQPILIYTAELIYYQNQELNKTATVYQSLNRFLRSTPILSLDFDVMKKQWRYLYSNALLIHLKKIPAYKGKTYRGITYDPLAFVGKMITFKQFLSTSIRKEVALAFAKKNKNDKVKRMFEFNLLQGYPITEFSIYNNESEVLLEPFSDFEVLEIRKTVQKDKIKQKQKQQNCEYILEVYVLQQILTNKTLPDIKANFIIWIDDKPKEGQIIYSRIDMPEQITVFIQLLSTKQLEKWLYKNKFLFKDKTANIIFITNMTRKQGDRVNQLAGIQGLNAIRIYQDLSNLQVFFYVGNVQKLEQKFAKCKASRNNVQVGVKWTQVFKYITKRIQSKQQSSD